MDPTTGRVGQIGDPFSQKAQNRDARRRREILRRQRILSGAGYKIVVDGVWGSRSQKAWMEYLRSRSVVEKTSPADKLDLTDPDAAPGRRIDKREQQRLARQEMRRKAEIEAKRQMKREQEAILARAGRLRRDPGLGNVMAFRDLAQVLVDDAVGYDPLKDRALTRALQNHLKHNGFKVKVTGEFDEATNEALKKAFERAEQEERRQQIAFVNERLIKTGILKPGTSPDWWTMGKIPEPGELLDILQRGGFDADIMLRQLLIQALSPQVAWNAARTRQLFEIAQTVQPLGAAAIGEIADDPNAVAAWQYMAAILSVSDLMPFGDYSELPEDVRIEVLKRRAKSEELMVRNAEAVGKTRAQAKALLESMGVEEFQRKMGFLFRQEDKRVKEFQQKLARRTGFWGDVIDAVLLPGEELRNLAVASVVNNARSFVAWKDGRMLDEDELVRREEAEKIIKDMNPVARFAFELTVDPLNLVAPTRIFSAGAYATTRVAARGGARVGIRGAEDFGTSLGRYVLTGEGLSRALVYQKGTWDKAAVGRWLAGSDDVLRLQESRLGEKVAEMQRRLAQTKDEAMSSISKRLDHASVLGWKQPKFKVAGTTIKLPKIGDKKAAKLLEETDRELVEAVANGPFLKPLIHELKQKSASLYLNAHRLGKKSQYGANLRGYFAELYRPIIMARLAVEQANGVYRKTLFDRFGAEWESVTDKAAQNEAKQAAIQTYMDVIHGFGPYTAAGPNPALREAELHAFDATTKTLSTTKRDLVEKLEKRVNVLLEETEKVVFPAIQDELERHADTLLERSKALAAQAAERAALVPTEREKLFADVIANPDDYVFHGTPDAENAMSIEEVGLESLMDSPTVAGRWEDTLDYAQGGYVLVFRKQDFLPDFLARGQKPVGVFRARDFATEWKPGQRTAERGGFEDEGLPQIEGKPSVRNFLGSEWDGSLPGAQAADGAKAATDHPLWEDDGLWRGRHAAQEGDLVATIRKSFEPGEMPWIRNPRHGVPHTAVQMGRAYKSELRRRVGRLEDYAGRRVESGTVDPDPLARAAAASRFEEERAKIIQEVKDAWQQGPDGMFYDTRKQIQTSNLYLRHLDRFGKRRLDFSGNDDVDFLALLGEAAGPGEKLTAFEEGLFKFAASMTQLGQVPLAGTKGFLTPGVRGDRNYVTFLRQAVDKRMFALHRAEASALSSEFLAQGALWRAWQHANMLPLKLAYKAIAAQLHLWKFATLALRPAWAVRNFIDNTVKAIIKGVRDPRYFLVGPGMKVGSVLSQDIAQLRQLIRFADDMFGTTIGVHFDRITAKVWELPSHVLSRIFHMHNIEIAPEVFEQGLKRDIFDRDMGLKLTTVASDERLIELGLKTKPSKVRDLGVNLALKGKALEDFFWNILGEAPENYARATIFRKAYADAIKDIMRKGVMRRELNGDQLARISVDEDKLRAALERMVGERLAGKIQVDIVRVRMDDTPYAGRFFPGHDGGGLIEVYVPTDLAVRSREEANALIRDFANTFAHEVRHAEQKRLASRGAVSKLDFKVPYSIRPSEVDARVFGRVREPIAQEAFVVENVLPSELSSVDIHLAATNRAMQAVEDTLFDYSKISVAEDNLKVFFPFIQYWRKNSVFWAGSFGEKPWLTNAVLQFDDERRDAHGDLPIWMQRYFHTDEIADALAVVPGLSEAFQMLGLGDGAQFDPINMLSLAPFYRAFKDTAYGENVNLPVDRPGVKVIAPMMDALNDWGLGINPLFRKPLEAAGIANYRAWQRVYPQTSLMEAIADASGAEGIARLARSLDRIGALGFPVTDSNSISENFDYWVQTVVAEQMARGEQPNLAEAEETVRDWFLVQNLWGYFGGIYWRRATPEDMYLSKLQDDVLNGHLDFEKLSTKEKKLLRMWGMRGMDRLVYDRYIDLMPVIEAYYRADLEGKDEIVKDNPEIIRWVDGDFTGHAVSQKFIRYAHRYVDQELFFEAVDIADSLDVAPDLRDVVNDIFVSPELREFWKLNNTPSRIRDRMVQAEVREYINELNRAYWSIPESDFDARDAFLEDHPELSRAWNRNNDPSDDYDAIGGHVKADLRDVYFRIVKERGFEGAADFLKQYSFMFEGTTSEKKIQDGEWIPGKGKWSAERIRDYREAKPHLTWFFDKVMPRMGEKKAWAWLEESDADAAAIIRGYLKKYPSAHRLAWLKAAPFLRIYFGLPRDKRAEWLRGDSEGAKIVRDYFEKYADEKGLTQHAKDYLEAKDDLKFYFSMSKEKRAEWLKSDDPRAVKVLAYFKKYGKAHQFEKSFKKLVAKYPELRHGTPEQARRMEFWRRYFALTPDQRPTFVLQHAEAAGVFIYGEFGEKEMHDREQEYMRRAVGLGLSKRQSAYLYVRPLLQFYRTLGSEEKGLFIRANPELQWYFDNFSKKSLTGDKKLDKLVEQYFKYPPDSFMRSAFLRKHPEVQEWFDKRSSPAEAAIRSMLEQYFALDGWERPDFLLDHPEVAAYFEQRRDERAQEQDALQAFDQADPRLRPFFEDAADLERAAQRMRERLRRMALDSVTPDGIGVRRERRPAA